MSKPMGFFPPKQSRAAGRTRRCRFCGEPGLRWEMVVKVWRLVDEQGRPHECEEYLESKERGERWSRDFGLGAGGGR